MSIMPGRPPRNGQRPRRADDGGRGRPATPSVHPPAPGQGRPGDPPRPPRELESDPVERRAFEGEGGEWVAWVSGKAAWGSGAYGLGMVVAVHFAKADAPDQPVREALLARGRFGGLFDEELRALLAGAVPIVTGAPPRTDAARPRRSREW